MLRKKVYILIKETGAKIFTPKGKNSWVQKEISFGGHNLSNINEIENLQEALSETPKLKWLKLTGELRVVINSSRTAVRIAKLPGDKPLKPDDEWVLVEESFPIGGKMNETTHVFDGSIFSNNIRTEERRFLMAALPIGICEAAGKLGEAIFGRPKCIDIIEHMVMRHYADCAQDVMLILLPQDEGLRILHMVRGLPHEVYAISKTPDIREDELSRIWQGLLEDIPSRVILLDSCSDSEWTWVQKFFEDREISVETEIFEFTKFI